MKGFGKFAGAFALGFVIFLIVGVTGPVSNAAADGPGHSARIYHRTDSKVKYITACKDAASDSACKSGSAREPLARGETTPKGDWDGYFCPKGHSCRTYYGAVYTNHPSRTYTFFVKVSGCGGCTKGVRVM